MNGNDDSDFWPVDPSASARSPYSQWQRPQDDRRYRAFTTNSQPGAAKSLRLIPAKHTGQPVVRIPYLQPITIEEHPSTKQLCLLCHSSHHVVFIEGENLEPLAEAIDEKKAKAVYQHDLNTHGKVPSGETVIIKITVENREN